MAGWRYFATTLNGDGTESLLHPDLPLSGVRLTYSISMPDRIECNITPEVLALKGSDGRPIFVPLKTAIYAEADGLIRIGAIVNGLNPEDEKLTLRSEGFSDYLNHLAWTDAPVIRYGVDPADMYRLIWTTVQKHPRGNIGVTVDPLTTKIKVGTKIAEVKDKQGNVTTQGVDEPFVLAKYNTTNLGQQADDLLKEASIDYREEHAWAANDTIAHRIRLAYPRMGARLPHLRFAIGENIMVPGINIDAEDYASEVLVQAAGEGPRMVTSHAVNPHADRLRVVAVKQAKHIGRQSSADASANAWLKLLTSSPDDIDQLVIRDHANAPFYSFAPGDEVLVQGPAGWAGDLSVWVRILEVTYSPPSSTANLTVIRADRT